MPHNKPNLKWPGIGEARVPLRIYHDPEIYAAEMEKVFYGATWNYVGLAAEIPNAGDFRRNFIGEREVLMLRKPSGDIAVVENRCAHRGSQICQARTGNTGEALICPYHQWTYDFDGNLTGVPFRRGVKGKGGMPKDFELKDHGLNRLRTETLNGVVFASFDPDIPTLADYMGPAMHKYFTRVFDGRELRLIGNQRQIIDCNWKFQMENLKDPYHAGLLHLFLVSFGLFRVDQKAEALLDDAKGHSAILSRRATADDHEGLEDVMRFTPEYTLEDPRLIEPRKEFPDDVTLAIQTIFPSIIIQAQSNTLATRHVIPKGVGRHELVWTFFGFADDDAEMRTLRLRQANLMGAAGYVTLDDAEVLEFSQIGVTGADPEANAVLDLGGRDLEPVDHMVTEVPIRGFHHRYRTMMDFET